MPVKARAGEPVSTLSLNISNLSEGVHQRTLEASPGEVGLDGRFSGPTVVSATLEKTSRQLFLTVEFTTEAVFTCDRCLEEFRKELGGKYQLVYVADERAQAGIEDDEVQLLSPDANTIDLTEDVRQFILLALPQKTLCREDCAGICPVCGVNQNQTPCDCEVGETDPRWEGLKKLLGD